MAVTPDDIRLRTKTKDDAVALRQDIDTAAALLAAYIDDDEAQAAVPETIFDAAHLTVALELYNQRKARNGAPNQQYVEGVGVVAAAAEPRTSRDPLAGAYPILRDFVSQVRFA